MLISKIVPFPKDKPDDIVAPITAITKMVIDYNLELGIEDPIFDVETFVTDWAKDDQHVMGFFDQEEMVGFIFASTQHARYYDDSYMLVESIYLKPPYRTAGTENVERAVATGLAYAKKMGLRSIRVHAAPTHAEFLKQRGGEVLYTGMEIPT